MVKKALLVGISYKNTAYQLGGCINDACSMYNLLTTKYNYLPNNIRMLCDDPSAMTCGVNSGIPTRSNILTSFQWLLFGSKKGDILTFYISSHGELVGNNVNELTGHDEAIRCLNNEFLLDNDIRSVLISKVPINVQLTCFFDCCHSGTMADLKYNYIYNPYSSNVFTLGIEKNLDVPGNIITYSACYDSETSGNASFGGKFITNPNGTQTFQWGPQMGCFTYYLIQTLVEHNYNIEYSDLLKTIYEKLLANGYNQHPEFGCSKPQMFTLPFNL